MGKTDGTPQSGVAAEFSVYILAGGKSRRFGNDKARAVVDGAPLIARLAEMFAGSARSVTVVSDRDRRYQDLGLRTIGDVVSEKGPIGGLLTAIDDHGLAGWIFVSACDWVGIRRPWIRLLIDRLSGAPAGAGAVVFHSTRGFEPLLGFYNTLIRDTLFQEIEGGRLKLQNLLAKIEAVPVPAPDDWNQAVNLNRPPDHN